LRAVKKYLPGVSKFDIEHGLILFVGWEKLNGCQEKGRKNQGEDESCRKEKGGKEKGARQESGQKEQKPNKKSGEQSHTEKNENSS
jgi:hypothetical protein